MKGVTWINTQQVMNGTWGELWIDGEYMAEVTAFEAKYNENNITSGNLLSKLGFVQDGVLRDRRVNRLNGERNNLIVFSILKKEYIESSA